MTTNRIKHILIIIFAALGLNNSYSQDLVEDIAAPVELAENRESFTETIRIIGRSKKVFIITNTNQMLFKGDFITMVFNERDTIARAVVAKLHNELVGIKILRIYSLKRWKKLRKNIDVNIYKGDDSWLFKKEAPKKKEAAEDEVRIKGEEDLYDDDTFIGDDLDSFGKDNRLIKPDNIVSAAWGRYSIENTLANDGDGETQVFNEFSGAWAYQFADNIWVEGLFGRTQLSNFPSGNKETVLSDFVARVKYTFQAPLYSYFQPYIGFQMYSVSSPNAGEGGTDTENAKEDAIIQEMGKSQIVVGVTILRRLVPGWFVKADLGSDMFNVGFAIEF